MIKHVMTLCGLYDDDDVDDEESFTRQDKTFKQA